VVLIFFPFVKFRAFPFSPFRKWLYDDSFMRLVAFPPRARLSRSNRHYSPSFSLSAFIGWIFFPFPPFGDSILLREILQVFITPGNGKNGEPLPPVAMFSGAPSSFFRTHLFFSLAGEKILAFFFFLSPSVLCPATPSPFSPYAAEATRPVRFLLSRAYNPEPPLTRVSFPPLFFLDKIKEDTAG